MNREFSQIYAIEHNQEQLCYEPFGIFVVIIATIGIILSWRYLSK